MLNKMEDDLMEMLKTLYAMGHHPSATADQSDFYQSVAADLVDAYDKLVAYSLLESV